MQHTVHTVEYVSSAIPPFTPKFVHKIEKTHLFLYAIYTGPLTCKYDYTNAMTKIYQYL